MSIRFDVTDILKTLICREVRCRIRHKGNSNSLALEQAINAQRGSRGIALFFL
jgi:hypothetical protein